MFTKLKKKLFCLLVRDLRVMGSHVANRNEYTFQIGTTEVRVIFRDTTKLDGYDDYEIAIMRDIVEHDYVARMKMFSQEDLCNIQTEEE